MSESSQGSASGRMPAAPPTPATQAPAPPRAPVKPAVPSKPATPGKPTQAVAEAKPAVPALDTVKHTAEVDDLFSMLENAVASSQDAASSGEALVGEKEELQQKLSAALDNASSLNTSLQEQTRQTEQAQAATVRTQASLDSEKAAHDRSRAELAAARSRLAELDRELDINKAVVKKDVDAVARMKKMIAEMSSNLARLQAAMKPKAPLAPKADDTTVIEAAPGVNAGQPPMSDPLIDHHDVGPAPKD